MLEWIRSFFSGVTVYLIPLVPMGILLWYSEHRSNRTLARFGTVQTGYAARETVKMMLQKKSMTVPIERSDDYSQNAYLPLEDKIMLSPNTCDQRTSPRWDWPLARRGKRSSPRPLRRWPKFSIRWTT